METTHKKADVSIPQKIYISKQLRKVQNFNVICDETDMNPEMDRWHIAEVFGRRTTTDIHSPFHACCKMAKYTLKILQCSHHKIFKVCLAILQHYAWKS